MKKIFTLIVLFISFCMILPLNAQNLLSGWDGNGVTGDLSKPSDVGWLNAPATTANLWNVANGSSGCRFRDSGVSGGYTANSVSYENAATTYLTSRYLMVRWDNSAYSTSYYAYPVTLQANTSYTFTMDYFYGGSGSAGLTLTAGISTTVDKTGQLSSSTFTTTAVNVVRKGSFIFTSGPTDGTYYFTFNGAWAWFGVANLNLVKSSDLMDDLNTQYTNLTLGNLNGVSSKITLPKTAGSKGVTIRWASSKPAIIDTLGNVNPPAKYDAIVNLTATLSQTIDGEPFTLSKSFTAKVMGIIPTPDQIAKWDFKTANITLENDTLKVTDELSGFKGKLVNDARIRTIGTTEKINVLDLGNGKGYFDMGKEIGKIIYGLADHTIMGYFRVDNAYTNLTANGNYIWNFGNSDNIGSNANGWMYGRLGAEAAGLSSGGSPSTSTSAATPVPQGAWHHIAYTLSGTTGTVYIDGMQVAQKTNMPLPGIALVKDSMSGTICNWLGRSSWASDAYLQQTLLYDFRMFSFTLTPDDLNIGFEGFDGIGATLDRLNMAYAENSDYTAPELTTEMNNLSLGDLSAITSNITLPSTGSLDPSIAIIWKTSNANLISATGVVTRPGYYNYNVTLTATLTKNGQSITKAFPATVVVADGTQFSNNLLVKYDFSTMMSDTLVTDVAEKHFTGVLKNDATIRTIGTTNKYNVLSLGDSIGYFDMGKEVGKLMYNLSDYTMSAYYRIDTAYTGLSSAGNFLWNFSNSTMAGTDQNGYIIGALNNQSVSITPKYYTAASGNQAVSFGVAALMGGWHNLTYTQNGTVGTVYIDGMPMATNDSITNLPSTALAKDGQLGTLYNWIGRSCFTSDVYLRKTLVYDVRLYKTALTDEQIQTSVLNVGATINALDAAYEETPNALKSVLNTQFSAVSLFGAIKITGLAGNEKVSLYDITGRQLKVNNPSMIPVNTGVYIVRINNFATKVLVR